MIWGAGGDEKDETTDSQRRDKMLVAAWRSRVSFGKRRDLLLRMFQGPFLAQRTHLPSIGRLEVADLQRTMVRKVQCLCGVNLGYGDSVHLCRYGWRMTDLQVSSQRYRPCVNDGAVGRPMYLTGGAIRRSGAVPVALADGSRIVVYPGANGQELEPWCLWCLFGAEIGATYAEQLKQLPQTRS